MPDEAQITKKRKDEHIDIALHQNVSHGRKTTGLEDVHIEGFEGVELDYRTLPEMALSEVDIATKFLGKRFSAPLMVSGMVGGTEKATPINRNVAQAAEALHLGLGVGSQRAMIEKPELAATYMVRDIAPTCFLAGNIGVFQLKKYSVEQLEEMLEKIGADALAIHLNAAQEAVQKEGDTDFSGCVAAIDHVAKELSKPVYVKEVGHGIGTAVAKRLSKTRIVAIDVQGVGGTSWTAIEGLRGNPDVGKTYWNFGVPTAVSIVLVRKVFKGPIIASGGIRNGLDVAKSLVLGADLAGFAIPALQAQNAGGSDAVKKRLETVVQEIRIACYLLGCKNLKGLKKQKPILTGKTRDWVEQALGKR
jgi:isopentenyl-diphosphate delta-isomerase